MIGAYLSQENGFLNLYLPPCGMGPLIHGEAPAAVLICNSCWVQSVLQGCPCWAGKVLWVHGRVTGIDGRVIKQSRRSQVAEPGNEKDPKVSASAVAVRFPIRPASKVFLDLGSALLLICLMNPVPSVCTALDKGQVPYSLNFDAGRLAGEAEAGEG